MQTTTLSTPTARSRSLEGAARAVAAAAKVVLRQRLVARHRVAVERYRDDPDLPCVCAPVAAALV